MPERISHYRILERIGVGGMGTVYRALDERSGGSVAVKVLHPHLAADPQYIRRFRREARIARSLDSPHVVQVLDYGQEGHDNYLVMEYVPSGDLAALIKRTGPLPIASVVSIARQVTLALAEGHRKGIVHRDVTPQNILFAEDGTAKLADFGIARDVTDLATMATTFMGKPHYASPDQWSGTVDIRSDIYSLGTVLYEMLAGVPPFSGPTPMAVMRQHDQADAPPLAKARPDAPLELVQVVERCLAKRPDQRYQTPTELLANLQAIRTPASGVAMPAHQPSRPKAALLAGVVVGTGGIITALMIGLAVFGDGDAESSVQSLAAEPQSDSSASPTGPAESSGGDADTDEGPSEPAGRIYLVDDSQIAAGVLQGPPPHLIPHRVRVRGYDMLRVGPNRTGLAERITVTPSPGLVGGVVIDADWIFLFFPPETASGDYEVSIALEDGEAAVGTVHHVQPAAISLPDRSDCSAIRADGNYRSDGEREWFLANCQPTPTPGRLAMVTVPGTCAAGKTFTVRVTNEGGSPIQADLRWELVPTRPGQVMVTQPLRGPGSPPPPTFAPQESRDLEVIPVVADRDVIARLLVGGQVTATERCRT
jgi:serine/threonine protein kinase